MQIWKVQIVLKSLLFVMVFIGIHLTLSISWRHLFPEPYGRMARIAGMVFVAVQHFFRVDVDTGSLLMFAQCGTQAAKSATKFRKVAGTWWLYFVQKKVLVARFCCFEFFGLR